VHERYGAWGQEALDRRTVVGPLRSTFVLDEGGRIGRALNGVPARGHVAGLRRLLGVDPPGA
jgi:peroxiredoxin Q/BCP